MANGKLSKGFWRFVVWITVLVLLLIAVLYHWYTYDKTPPPNPNAPELKALRNEVKSLKKSIALEKENASEAWAEVDRLKQYQVTLLDSIEKMKSAVAPKMETKAETRARTETKATHDKSIRSVRTTVVCNCPTAFGYYRNRGTRAVLTKKYCKIHGK